MPNPRVCAQQSSVETPISQQELNLLFFKSHASLNFSQNGILPLRPPDPPRHLHRCRGHAQPASGVHKWPRRVCSCSCSTSTCTCSSCTCTSSSLWCTSSSCQHQIPWLQLRSHPASSAAAGLWRLRSIHSRSQCQLQPGPCEHRRRSRSRSSGSDCCRQLSLWPEL